MSTITVQTISNGSVSTSSANVISGSAKAWCNFNGTGTVAIRASYNVSSITDNGTGKYTVNYTNAMPDANYSFQMHCIDITGGDRTVIAGGSTDSIAPTASALNFNTFSSLNAGLIDANWIAVAIFR